MFPEKKMREKRTISNKDTNYLKFPNKLQRYSRFLSRKISNTSPEKQPKKNIKEHCLSSYHKEHSVKPKQNSGNVAAKEDKDTQHLQNNVANEEATECLTRSNLKKLQEKILDRELNDIACDHCLCSTENRRDIKYSRLWFLLSWK